MDLTTHPDLVGISTEMKNAMIQLKDADAKGDTAKAKEISDDYSKLESLYASTENEINAAKLANQDRAVQWLASSPSQSELASIGTQESFTKSGTDIPAEAVVSTVKRAISSVKSSEDIQNNLATALDIPQDQIDIKSGLTGTTRFTVGMLPTPESKLEYLQNTFKPENVKPVNISGSPSFVVQRGGKWVLVDELGASFSDFTADVLGEAGPLVGAIAGGVVGGKMGKAVAAGSAAGQMAAGSVQDVAMRLGTGLPVDAAEIAARRGIEAGIGYLIDKTGQLLTRPAIKRIGENIPNKLATSISEAQKLLKGEGVETTAPIMNIFGREALESQKERMGRQATGIGSRAGSAAERTLDLLGQFRNQLQGEDIPLDYNRIINRQKANERLLLSQIAKYDQQGARIVENNLQKNFDDLAVKNFSKKASGEAIRDNLALAKDGLKKIKNESYDEFYQLADQSGIEMTPAQIADALETGSKSLGKEIRNPEIDKQIIELRARQQLRDDASKLEGELTKAGRQPTPDEYKLLDAAAKDSNLGPRDIDDRVRMAEELVGGEAFGSGSTGASVATAAAQELRSVRDAMYSSAGLKEAWDKSTEAYTNALGTRGGAVGRALAVKYGDSTKTGTMVINDIIRDPQYIQDAIEFSTLSGNPANAELTRKGLQDAYLAKLGLTTSKGNMSGKLNIDDDIVRSLWQTTDAEGKPNLLEANRVSEKLRNLNKAFGQSHIDLKKIKPDDVKKLFSTLGTDEEKAVIESMKASASAQNAKDLFTGNSIIKAASKGNWDITDSTGFTEALFNADVGEVSRLVKKLPANVKPSVQSDFVGRLFRDYPSNAETTNGTELFDASSVLEDLAGQKGKQLESRIKQVMGNKWFDSFKAAATVMDANMFQKTTESRIGLKASGGGTGGSRLFFVGDLAKIATDRLISGVQGIGALEPMFNLMAKKVSRETVDKNWSKALQGISGSRAGIMALSHAVRDDPEEAQKLSDLYKQAASQGGSQSERFKANMGR